MFNLKQPQLFMTKILETESQKSGNVSTRMCNLKDTEPSGWKKEMLSVGEGSGRIRRGEGPKSVHRLSSIIFVTDINKMMYNIATCDINEMIA